MSTGLRWFRFSCLLLSATSGCAVLSSVGGAIGVERPGSFPMPEVRKLSEQDARKKLLAEGKIGDIDVQRTDCGDDEIAPGLVCNQAPVPGAETSARTPAVLYLQSERRYATMPDVVGKTVEEARRILNEAGFRNITVRESSDAPGTCEPKTVCATQPPGREKHASFDVEKTIWIAPANRKPTTVGNQEPKHDERRPDSQTKKPIVPSKPQDSFF